MCYCELEKRSVNELSKDMAATTARGSKEWRALALKTKKESLTRDYDGYPRINGVEAK